MKQVQYRGVEMITLVYHMASFGQCEVFGQALCLQIQRNYYQSSLVNYVFAFPAQLFAIYCSSKKSLRHSYFPSTYVQIRAKIRPYFSDYPASILTIFPSIIPITISLTFFPNSLASPLRVQGVSIPPSLKINLAGALLIHTAALIVSPSVTLTTFPRKVLQFNENYSASLSYKSSLYCSFVNGCILDRVTPQGRNVFRAVQIIYFLLRRMAVDFLRGCFYTLLSFAEDPKLTDIYLSPQLCTTNLILSLSKQYKKLEFIIFMIADQIKFNLPKVRIRIKTEPVCVGNDKQPHSFKQYQAAPPVFQQRQKMKKEIQQSYLRFRKMRKNNYVRHFSNVKKYSSCQEQKRFSTISVKAKQEESKKSFQFALEVDGNRKSDAQSYKANKDRQKLVCSLISNKPNSNRQILGESITSFKNVSLAKHSSLYQSCLQATEESTIQLEGKRCNYSPIRDKSRLVQFKNDNKIKRFKKAKVSRLNTFQIDPWKDNGSQLNFYLQQQNF